MFTDPLNHLDGIRRHSLRVGPETEAQRVDRLAKVAGRGVAPSSAFSRDPAYRHQLGELIELAGRGRVAL